MIADIRTYFDNAVKEVDPDLVFIDDPFGQQDVSDTIADKFYKLYFGAAIFSRSGNHYIEEIPATLEVYAGRRRDSTQAFDEVYQKALLIKQQVECPIDDKGSLAFTEIISVSATPEPLPNSDNTIKIILEFNVRIDLIY